MRVLLAASIVACGSASGVHSPPTSDAGPATDRAPPAEAGTRDANVSDASPESGPIAYPAPHPPMPRVVNSGGLVLLAPTVVPIEYPSDPYASQIADFLTTVGTTSYWAGATGEYGVGAVTMGTPVVLTEDPFSSSAVDDTQIQTWLTSAIGGALPASDGNTIYVLYFPAGTTITVEGVTTCVQLGGYHGQVMLENGQSVPYAVIPRCASFAGFTGVDVITATSSHEIIEASTDPLPQTSPAYASVDQAYAVWQLVLGGGEIGDMCAQNVGAFYQPEGFAYDVQRVWSNTAAAASHDPCAPSLGGTYFNAAPVLPDAITLDFGQPITTQGVTIAVGQKRTVALDLYSDGPTGGPWTVGAKDYAALQGQPAELSFSFDKTSGQNGDILQMTVEVLSEGQGGIEPFLVISQLGRQANFWIGLVSND